MRTSLSKVFITCAITGNITTPAQTPHLPVTPAEIADSALEAADAGAAIAHIHVRDPATGHPSMDIVLYREVMDRIRAHNESLIINLTTGPGGRFAPSSDNPRIAGPGTTLTTPEERVKHVVALRPDICTLDLNTMNSGGQVVINTPGSVRRMARDILASGVKPEIELFDSGDIALLRDLLDDGTLPGPPLASLVMGVKYGFQQSIETVTYARNLLPPDAPFTAIGIGKACFQAVAISYLSGGHVRVGLEDSIYLDRGMLASSNAAMVAKARRLVEDLGGQIASAAETRQILSL
jgi:3-dehydrocarnitine:acetyl-CoA trimethylamine transferase